MIEEFNDSNDDSNEGAEGETTRMSLRERHPRQAQLQNNDKRLRNKQDELKFLQNFNPEQSNRERRKLKRKSQSNLNKNFPYSETGAIRSNGLNICDCMNKSCLGCFYECETCGSTKCGPTCRCNRKYMYEMYIFDGKETVIPNAYYNLK